ncbi:hypothetical protein Cgig2_024755 [Carnegiea gigantea]|uniref:Uncharacterized protein n=1 Tax=Carnegiea gigantea TaxID=171969 RepID=A0A9Q1QA72_9CARY|nr:hypothetical protein Cgig2_024755 [Carnegiea gigantea]
MADAVETKPGHRESETWRLPTSTMIVVDNPSMAAEGPETWHPPTFVMMVANMDSGSHSETIGTPTPLTDPSPSPPPPVSSAARLLPRLPQVNEQIDEVDPSDFPAASRATKLESSFAIATVLEDSDSDGQAISEVIDLNFGVVVEDVLAAGMYPNQWADLGHCPALRPARASSPKLPLSLFSMDWPNSFPSISAYFHLKHRMLVTVELQISSSLKNVSYGVGTVKIQLLKGEISRE